MQWRGAGVVNISAHSGPSTEVAILDHHGGMPGRGKKSPPPPLRLESAYRGGTDNRGRFRWAPIAAHRPIAAHAGSHRLTRRDPMADARRDSPLPSYGRATFYKPTGAWSAMAPAPGFTSQLCSSP